MGWGWCYGQWAPPAPNTGFVAVAAGGLHSLGIKGLPCQSCDVNCDGSVNGFDIQPFVGLLDGTGTPCSACAGDINSDGSINGFDIQGFVECLKAP